MRCHRLSEVIQIRLTPSVVQRLDEIAEEQQTTRADILRRLIVEELRRKERSTAEVSE